MIIPRYCPIWSASSPYRAVRACPFGRDIESCYCGILWGAEDIWDLHFLSLGLCPIKGKEIQSLPEVLGKNTIFQKTLRWKESFGHWSLADAHNPRVGEQLSRICVKNRIESSTNKEKITGPTGRCKIYPKLCNIGYGQCQRPTGAKGFLILETTLGSGPQVHQSLVAVSPSMSHFVTLRARDLRVYLGSFFLVTNLT